MNPNVVLTIGVFGLILVLVYVWRRRRLYYIASKLDGPLAFPFIGSLYLAAGDYKNVYNKLKAIISSGQKLSKIWLGPYLVFIDSRPEDMETLLNNCLDKPFFYNFGAECFGNGLATAPVEIWKGHRKLINKSFNMPLLNTFHESFVKETNNLMTDLKGFCGKGRVDLFPKLFKCTLNMVCESLCDVDSSHLKGQEDYIGAMLLYTASLIERLCNPLHFVPFFWKISYMHKRTSAMIDTAFGFIKKIVALNRSAIVEKNDLLKKKNFLNHLVTLGEQNLFSEKEILDEIQIMLLGGSETTAITLSFAILAIGIYPKIQENICKELDSIFEGSSRDSTPNDLNKMDYLERVIKETLRLLSPIPLFGRDVSKDIQLSDGLVLPSGTSVLIPLFKMNRDPKIWRHPLQFDPDRFLPDEVKTRHQHSFIPFSLGPRNCIGFKFAMWSMKVSLSTFLRNYKIASVDYKSIHEIEEEWATLVKPKNGCQVVLEERLK